MIKWYNIFDFFLVQEKQQTLRKIREGVFCNDSCNVFRLFLV